MLNILNLRFYLIEKKQTLQVLRRNNKSFLTHIIRLFTLQNIPKSSQYSKESCFFFGNLMDNENFLISVK